MSTYTEAKHVRGGDVANSGRYSHKTTSAPALSLGGVDDRAAGKLADELASTGLAGSLRAYEGTNSDYHDGALIYTSPGGRELVLDESPYEGFVVANDTNDEYHFRIGTDGDTSEDKVNAIRRATWDLAVTDAQYGLEGGLSQEGDLYELREFTIEESEQGPLGSFMVSNFDDDSWTHISCDLKSGEVTVSRESELLSGLAEDAELDAILVDLRSEPESGDSYKEHIAQLFNRTVVQTAGDPDCQEWATDYVSKSKNR